MHIYALKCNNDTQYGGRRVTTLNFTAAELTELVFTFCITHFCLVFNSSYNLISLSCPFYFLLLIMPSLFPQTEAILMCTFIGMQLNFSHVTFIKMDAQN